MDGPLARYVSRSPRYILQAQDNTLIRVAGPHQTPWEEGTEIKNVSLSGLAFTAANDFCPNLNEVIKIQFEAPGASQMACLGTVSRIEQGPTTSLIAVRFLQLELSQRIYLHKSLSPKIKAFGSKEDDVIRIRKFSGRKLQLVATLLFLAAWSLLNWFWWKS